MCVILLPVVKYNDKLVEIYTTFSMAVCNELIPQYIYCNFS